MLASRLDLITLKMSTKIFNNNNNNNNNIFLNYFKHIFRLTFLSTHLDLMTLKMLSKTPNNSSK